MKASILIPCHNAAQWIDQAIHSALAQTYPDKEIIVIDDGSSDQSPQLLEKWRERISVLIRANRGGNPTRNELLQMASGDWVQFLDADDYLLPQKLSRQLACLQQQPHARWIYAPLTIEEHHDATHHQRVMDPHDPRGDHDPWAYHLGWHLTQTGGALFHRQTLIEVGGWNEQQPCCQDNEVFFRLLKAGAECLRCPYPDAVYRRFSSGSVSTSNQRRLLTEILRLLAEAEAFLRQSDQWTARRSRAANQFRLSLARKVWLHDRANATAILRQIQSSNPQFSPSPADFAPPSYCKAFRLLGFQGAEWISFIKRLCLRK